MNLLSARILVILATVAFCFVASTSFDGSSQEVCLSVCASKDCLLHANLMLKHLNLDVDPCENFYEFACGGYAKKFGESETNRVYDEAWKTLQIQIRDLLDSLHPEPETASEKMKMSYDACMAVGASELRGVADALGFLARLGIGGWPNLPANFTFRSQDLSRVLGSFAAYREFSFLSFKASPYKAPDIENSRNSSVALVLPDVGLLNGKLKPQDVQRTVFKLLDYFGIDKNDSQLLWNDFEAIEGFIHRLQTESTEDSTKCQTSMKNTYAQLNCTEEQGTFRFLCSFWKTVVKTGRLEKEFLKEVLHVSCRWNHYRYAESVLLKLSNMTQRSIANYLALRFFIAHLEDMNLPLQRMRAVPSGVKGSKQPKTDSFSRWEYCVAWIIKSMNVALGYEYLRVQSLDPVISDAQIMIKTYTDELRHLIVKQRWIEERVRTYLTAQLEKIDIGFVASVQNYRNATFVERYYDEFHAVQESFLQTILEFQKYSTVMDQRKRTHFNGFISSSDPYVMDIGFALLLPPNYFHGIPKFLNFATLGWIIGHEIIHNFKFALDVMDLEENTERLLNSKFQCYFDKYSSNLSDQVGIIKPLKSEESKEEILADNLGWSLTEKIIEKYFGRLDKHNATLPINSYNQQQLFYIFSAQAFCEVLSKKVQRELSSSKLHSVEKFRIFSVIQNSKAFSEAFRCSVNSTMNPEWKCSFFD